MIWFKDPVKQMPRTGPPIPILLMLAVLLVADYTYFTTLVGIALNVSGWEKHLISLGATLVTLLLMSISANCIKDYRNSAGADKGRLVVGVAAFFSYIAWVAATAWFRLNSETGQSSLESMGQGDQGAFAQQMSTLMGAATSSAEATTFLMTMLLVVTGVVAFAASYAYPSDRDAGQADKAKVRNKKAAVTGELASLNLLEDGVSGRSSAKIERAAEYVRAQARHRAMVKLVEVMSDPSEGRFVEEAAKERVLH